MYNVDINELYISEDHQEEVGGDDDDLEEGALLGEEHQWLLCYNFVSRHLLNSEKHPFGGWFFEAVCEFGGLVFEPEEQFLKQFGSLVDQFWELGGPED